MDYLAFLFLGFCLGALAGLKLCEVMLAQLKQQLNKLDSGMNPKPEQRELRVATVDGQVLEDFT